MRSGLEWCVVFFSRLQTGSLFLFYGSVLGSFLVFWKISMPSLEERNTSLGLSPALPKFPGAFLKGGFDWWHEKMRAAVTQDSGSEGLNPNFLLNS